MIDKETKPANDPRGIQAVLASHRRALRKQPRKITSENENRRGAIMGAGSGRDASGMTRRLFDQLGESFVKMIYASAALADQINDKPSDKRTPEECEFIRAFEEVGEIVLDPRMNR